jgi:hypothetical protein
MPVKLPRPSLVVVGRVIEVLPVTKSGWLEDMTKGANEPGSDKPPPGFIGPPGRGGRSGRGPGSGPGGSFGPCSGIASIH